MKPPARKQHTRFVKLLLPLSSLLALYALFFFMLPGVEVGLAGPASGGLIYQDFEGSGDVGWAGPNCDARLTESSEPVHQGEYSWRISCWGDPFENYVYAHYKGGTWHTDLLGENNDRLTFWTYSSPTGGGAGTDVTIGVKFFDHSNYETEGFEVWSTNTAHNGEWTKLTILFDQLPNDLELDDIDKIEFKFYWPGTYYLDDIQAVREDRSYQSFEPSKRSLPITDTEEFGWVWNVPTDTYTLSDEQVHEGDYAWKTVFNNYWAGTGIKSEQEYLAPRIVTGGQTFWHIDLDPEFNDRLSFWVYALPLNGLDNNLNIQFYDHSAHNTDETKVEYWTNQPAIYGQWTQITIPFSDILEIAPDLTLTDINKLQFQVYWPGTYYFDQIEAASSVPNWDSCSLKDSILTWESDYPLNGYTLQENFHTGDHNDSRWMTVTTGTATTYTIPHVSQVWYRVRAEEIEDNNHEVPFKSAWSKVLAYNAPVVVINKARLVNEQALEWTELSQATSYEMESSPNSSGPWTQIYAGPYPADPLAAAVNTWYRVRTLSGTDTGIWSPPQRKPDPSGQDYLRAVGATIREENGTGYSVTLRGVNLGGYLLIESWMNEWSADDDYSIRQELETRFGEEGRDALIEIYRDAFLTEADFDIMIHMGLQFVRLPLYYVDLQDEDGNLLPSGFERIDWVVNTSADRGIYVLLDLHGAPGSQSREFHTGRMDYNMLFTDTVTGTMYQTRTVELWEAIAERYKDNPMVMGYDLLNEPTGVIADPNSGTPTEVGKIKLWDFYDTLYDAIRAIDPNHIIMMEGIWDWDTLPDPYSYGWENVVYQFHYYCPQNNNGDPCWTGLAYEDYVQAHKDFINSKIDMANSYQDTYQVPVMIGEFNAYDSRETWEYYLEKFNQQGWSWAIWNYKVASPNSRWGLLTNLSHAADDQPVFSTDPYALLETKLSEPFDTVCRYTKNYSLVGIVKSASFPYSVYLPFIVKAP